MTAVELYESVLYSMPMVFFQNPQDLVKNITDNQSAYETIMSLGLVTGEQMGVDFMPFAANVSAENFIVENRSVRKLGLFSQKKLYNVLTIEMRGRAETKEFRKLYFIYNDDFSDVYSCVGGSFEFAKFFSESDNDLSITIYNKDNRILGKITVDMSMSNSIRNFAYERSKDLYEIFRKILGLGDNFKDKIVI